MAQTQSQTRQKFIKANPGIQRPGYPGYWYRCAHCGKWCGRPGKGNSASVIPDSQKMEVDHILSWKHGGSDELWNLQPLCRPCNRSKSADASLGDSIKIVKNSIEHPVDTVMKSTLKRAIRSTGLIKRK